MGPPPETIWTKCFPTQPRGPGRALRPGFPCFSPVCFPPSTQGRLGSHPWRFRQTSRTSRWVPGSRVGALCLSPPATVAARQRMFRVLNLPSFPGRPARLWGRAAPSIMPFSSSSITRNFGMDHFKFSTSRDHGPGVGAHRLSTPPPSGIACQLQARLWGRARWRVRPSRRNRLALPHRASQRSGRGRASGLNVPSRVSTLVQTQAVP
jgi:hypothetical protein